MTLTKKQKRHALIILIGIIVVLLAIGFFVLIKLNSTTECYQETATIATSCGGLGTGAYSIITDDSSGDYYTYFNIDYSKPLNSIGAIWQVKFGYDKTTCGDMVYPTPYFYNITIPNVCFANQKLLLRFLTFLPSYYGDSKNSWAIGQCYIGTSWINITVLSLSDSVGCGSDCSSGDQTSGQTRWYDGIWVCSIPMTCWYPQGTGNTRVHSIMGGGISNIDGCGIKNTGKEAWTSIYEEAIIWRVKK